MLLWASLIVYRSTEKAILSSDLIMRTHEVRHMSDNVLLDILNIESGFRGYLLTKNHLFLEHYSSSSTTIVSYLAALAELTKDNPEQQLRIKALEKTAMDRLVYSNKIIDFAEREVLQEKDIADILYSGKILTDKVRNSINIINLEESKLLKQRNIDNDKNNEKVRLLYFGLLALAVFVCTVIVIFIIRQRAKSVLAGEQKQSSQYARSLIEASLDPLVTISSDGKITDVNEASITITGIPRKELIGTNFSNYFTEPEQADAGYRQVFEEGFVADYPLTIKHKNGKLTDVLYNASVYKDAAGKVLGVFAAARDVTEQKQSSQYARSLIEASLDPLVTISIDGKITDVNEASIKVTGIPREGLIDTDFSDYFTEPEKARAGYRQVFDKGFVADYPLTITHKSGKLTDVLYNASVYKDTNGKVLGVFAAARDVTEQKLFSKYSLSLIEASHDPLVAINAAGKITDINEATVNITGIMRERLTGTDFFDYFIETQKAREVYQEVFAKGYVIDSPLTLRHKDGKLTDVLFNGSVYKDDRGNVLGVVVVARDITDQKRFKNELIEAKGNAERATRKAEESNRLKESFLANMSHEIRTPMNAIIGFSDILSKRALGEQERDFVTIIKTAGENLLTIINDILDISKIEAGMMTFESHAFSVKEIFASLHVMLMEKAKEKNLELIFRSSESIPDVLIGDNTRLTQIIINLVGNAIKFTQKGRVEVTVEVLHTELESVLLEFSIIDTGIGIPQEKLDKIFERFIQAESHTTREYGGTGLGLSIARQLAELQGGKLTVRSIVGMGSVFTFQMPYKKSDKVVTVLPTFETNYNMDALRNLNVLLIEDNKMNVKLILSLFSEYGLHVEVAWNGSEGVEKLRAGNFDIVLMDMEMPVMNGYQAAVVIRRELKSTIPIIAMTAHAMVGEREKCLSLGMNDYITKPIHSNLLFEKMLHLTTSLQAAEKKEVNQDHEKVCDLRYITEMMAGKKHLIAGVMDEFLANSNRTKLD